MRSGRVNWQSAALREIYAVFAIIYIFPDPYVYLPSQLPFLLSHMGGAQRSSSSSPTPITGHGSVNIERAENSFNELSRQLTQGTIVDDREHEGEDTRVPTAMEKRMTKDLEKGEVELEEPFDLREYLTSSNDANERAGIKHKHVGVVWEDFHVDVLGGSDFKVGVKLSSSQ